MTSLYHGYFCKETLSKEGHIQGSRDGEVLSRMQYIFLVGTEVFLFLFTPVLK